ncbi:MAG TPA: hypothetical protein VHC49_01865 [Mycobacteriales bacterium]|nr:hypothetical protein [Mycobacteriales bacterium]
MTSRRIILDVNEVMLDCGRWQWYADAERRLAGHPAREALRDRQHREWTAYGLALAASVRRIAAELLPESTLEIDIRADPDLAGPSNPADDDLTWRILGRALAETPLPVG